MKKSISVQWFDGISNHNCLNIGAIAIPRSRIPAYYGIFTLIHQVVDNFFRVIFYPLISAKIKGFLIPWVGWIVLIAAEEDQFPVIFVLLIQIQHSISRTLQVRLACMVPLSVIGFFYNCWHNHWLLYRHCVGLHGRRRRFDHTFSRRSYCCCGRRGGNWRRNRRSHAIVQVFGHLAGQLDGKVEGLVGIAAALAFDLLGDGQVAGLELVGKHRDRHIPGDGHFAANNACAIAIRTNHEVFLAGFTCVVDLQVFILCLGLRDCYHRTCKCTATAYRSCIFIP